MASCNNATTKLERRILASSIIVSYLSDDVQETMKCMPLKTKIVAPVD